CGQFYPGAEAAPLLDEDSLALGENVTPGAAVYVHLSGGIDRVEDDVPVECLPRTRLLVDDASVTNLRGLAVRGDGDELHVLRTGRRRVLELGTRYGRSGRGRRRRS